MTLDSTNVKQATQMEVIVKVPLFSLPVSASNAALEKLCFDWMSFSVLWIRIAVKVSHDKGEQSYNITH